jgi:hypothetical protein
MPAVAALILACHAAVALRDPPPESDLLRFPPAPRVEDYRRFRNDYLEHLWGLYSWQCWNRPLILEAISEAESLWAPWEALYDAQHGCRPRHDLAWLRLQLGNDAYYRGRMPPPVPLWRFRPID